MTTTVIAPLPMYATVIRKPILPELVVDLVLAARSPGAGARVCRSDLPSTLLYSGALAMPHNEDPSGKTTSSAGPMAVGKDRAPIWEPDPDSVADAAITRFIGMVTATSGRRFDGYQALWSWSVEHLEEFWTTTRRHSPR